MIRLCKRAKNKLFTACAAASSILILMSGCSGTSQSSSPSKAQMSIGTVAIFTPDDGIDLTRKTPLSTWNILVPEIIKSLKSKGFPDNTITQKSSSSLSEQSQAIQDYVVNQIAPLQKKQSGKNSSKTLQDIKKKISHTTLLVAPWTNKKGSNDYGDFVTRPKVEDNSYNNNSKETTAETRFASALRLARESGMHVVMLSKSINGFDPDVIFNLSTASRIGELQAKTLVQKLALDRATSDDPKYIEVLLPCHNHHNPNNSSNKNSDTSSSTDYDDDDYSSNNDFNDEFAKEAFKGIWKVLRPYFASGTLLSPSGYLDSQTEEEDWVKVAFDADDPSSVKDELTKRLKNHARNSNNLPKHIDGLITLNDQVAMQATSALENLGYQGSAADINPSITLPDVIGNFIGKKDIVKRPVPAPKKDANNSEKSQNSGEKSSVHQQNDPGQAKRWPVMTGYGAYKETMPNIVNGKQWMTTIEDYQSIAKDIATTCASLNKTCKLSSSIKTIDTPSNTTKGKKIPTIVEPIMAVSATNLKALLIDPGFISMADAGL